MRAPALTLVGVTKQFPGTLAVNFDPQQSLEFEAGHIHALVGENGAGKSTLVGIIAGIQPPTSGEMRLGDDIYSPGDVLEARRQGVDIVLQEPGLVDNMTVEENLVLGRERQFAPFGLFAPQMRRRLAAAALEHLPRRLDLSQPTRSLTLEDQKLVELARALSLDPKVLVIDEMSACLSERGVRELFTVLQSFVSKGRLVVYISHHLEEVFELCDRVTVMKDGRLVNTLNAGDTNEDELSSLMVGRAMKATLYRPDETTHATAQPLLEVVGLSLAGRYRDVSFTLHRGEILGIGGLVGCGSEQLALCLFGALRASSGTVRLAGRLVSFHQPHAAIRGGIAYLPADRDRDGLILGLSVEKNVSLASLPWLSRLGFMSNRREEQVARRFIEQLRIVVRSGKDIPLRLSGGNRQKVVLSKWLVRDKEVLILHNPTRGVDVRGKAEIHALINELAGRGMGILLITDELPELIGMSDTIMMMRRGRVSGHTSRKERPTEERLISYML